jgi:predicted dehydrogenase
VIVINKILIVGFGSIGARHARVVKALYPNIEIGILHHRESATSQASDNHEFFSIEDALAFEPEIAIIANPSPFHVLVAQSLANAGIHLLIEKPLSDSMSQVEALFEIAKINHTLITVGYNLRFLKSLQKFKSILESGVIGRINSVQCSVGQYLPSWRPGTDYRKSVSANSGLGGGVLLELSHELDYLIWIFGSVDWVQAFIGRQSNLEIDVEDSVCLIMQHMGRSGNGPISASVNLDFIRHDSTRSCTAIGALASLRWDGINDGVEIWEANSDTWIELYKGVSERDESYESQFSNFMNAISEGDKEKVTLNNGVAALQLIEKIRISAIGGSRIYLSQKN